MGFVPPIAALFVALIISMMWTNFIGAPWVPSSMKDLHKMLTLAEVEPGDLVYDLGCGEGRTIITAATSYKAWAVGTEVYPNKPNVRSRTSEMGPKGERQDKISQQNYERGDNNE